MLKLPFVAARWRHVIFFDPKETFGLTCCMDRHAFTALSSEFSTALTSSSSTSDIVASAGLSSSALHTNRAAEDFRQAVLKNLPFGMRRV